MSVRTRQESTYKGNDRWIWSVWLEGTRKELDQIHHVVYTLHPSFKEPVRVISTRDNGFKLTSSGWGRFELFIGIVDNKGRARSRKHLLNLEYPRVDETAPSPKSGAGASKAQRATKPSTVYIASSAADIPLATALRKSLRLRHIITLAGADSIAPGMPFLSSVMRAMSRADTFIVVLSGRTTLGVHNEIEVAKSIGKPILAVLVGDAAAIPSNLRSALDELVVRRPSIDDIEALTDGVTAALDRLTPQLSGSR